VCACDCGFGLFGISGGDGDDVAEAGLFGDVFGGGLGFFEGAGGDYRSS
jgi:hypothetical protein